MKTTKRAYTSDQPGFSIFFAALFVAALIGFAFRAYFSPNRMEAKIRSALRGRTPGIQVDFSSAALVLNDGFWPRIGIEVRGLHIRKDPACGEGWGAEVDKLLLPLEVSSLLSERPRVGVAEAVNVQLRPDRFGTACRRGTVGVADAIAGAKAESRLPEPQNKSFLKTKDIEEARKWLSGFDIRQAQIFFEHDRKFVTLKDLRSRFDSNSYLISANGFLLIPANLTLDEALPIFKIKIDLEPELLTLNASGRFSEGLLEGVLKTTSANFSALSLRARTIPLSKFATFLEKAHFLPKLKIQPRFLWLSCQATASGEFSQLFKKNSVDIDNCEVEGDAGQLQIAHAVRKADGSWEPFHLNVLRIDIRKVFQAFNQDGPSGILSAFGTLQGDIDYQSVTKQAFAGSVKGVEVSFSNRGVHAKQAVDELKLKVKRDSSHLSGKISGIALHNGKANSSVDFEFFEDFKNGDLKIHAPDLALDPSVQKLMTLGNFSKLSAEAQLHFEGPILDRAKGELKAADYTGESLVLNKLQSSIQFAGHLFQMQSHAESGNLLKASSWFRWLAPVLTGTENSSSIRLQSLRMDVQVEDTNVKWRSIEAHLPDRRLQLFSEGSFEMAGIVEGKIHSTGLGMAPVIWSIRGTPKWPVLQKQ